MYSGFRPGPTQTGLDNQEKVQRLKNSDLGVELISEKEGADQLRLCFRSCKSRFSNDEAPIICAVSGLHQQSAY